MYQNLILAIESSCDDTSLCILNNDKILKQITISSAELQKQYGGVVPEIASREHLKNIHKIFNSLLIELNINPFDIKYICFTNEPGLVGSLHVCFVFAKMLSKLINAKLVPINHLYGHIFSAFINKQNEIKFPFLCLVASGGNTILYKVNDVDNIEIINQTQDDAIGEVFDKVSKALDWHYPGGPIIDRNYDAKKANIKFIKQTNKNKKTQFSFSGLKTAVLSYINTLKMKNQEIDKIQIASSFQKEAISLLIDKLQYYMIQYNIFSIVLGGGVSANSLLRTECEKITKKFYFPELCYTGDNASMIGFYGYLILKKQGFVC